MFSILIPYILLSGSPPAIGLCPSSMCCFAWTPPCCTLEITEVFKLKLILKFRGEPFSLGAAAVAALVEKNTLIFFKKIDFFLVYLFLPLPWELVFLAETVVAGLGKCNFAFF